MTEINSLLLKKFINEALKHLNGEWIIFGGTVLPLLNIDHRTTIDIDIAPIERNNKNQNLDLMQIAEDIGLPIEAINQAGSFFLYKIPDWRKNILLVKKNKTCSIYRPNGTLFLQLKISRLSSTDLSDCLVMIKYCKQNKEPIDHELIKLSIQKEMKNCLDLNKKSRLKELSSFID